MSKDETIQKINALLEKSDLRGVRIIYRFALSFFRGYMRGK